MNKKYQFYILYLISILILNGCGQTGPLYLPTPETSEKAESK